MLLNLVKKDFLLIKKNAIIMMFAGIAVILYLLWRDPELSGFPAFFLLTLYTEIILCQSVSVVEAKYPKASALLCAAPYSRGVFVKAKYVFTLFIFAYCFIAYSLVALLVPKAGSPDLAATLAAFLLIMLVCGIYMPLEFKFGYEKTRFAFIIILFGVSFGMPMFYGAHINLDLRWLAAIPAAVQCLVLGLAGVAVLFLSMNASIRIFSKKEL
jgi:hypothetical protein